MFAVGVDVVPPPTPAPPCPISKTPRPVRKNSRFSGKNRLNRVRLICCSSTSTCAKSVLYVRSAVRLAVTPYFASTPASASRSPFTAGVARRSVVSREIPYGLISTFLPAGGRSSPVSVAAAETRKKPGAPPLESGRGVRYEYSFLRRIERRIWRPHDWFVPARYRSDLKGIAISTVQPPSNR